MKVNIQPLTQNFLGIVVLLQVLMYLTLFLDLSVARAAIGIVYLTFVPGFVILKILKLHSLNSVETILYSVGFSVAFLMLAGLVINEFGGLVGLTFPLATLPLSLFINTLIIVGVAIAYLRQGSKKAVVPQEVGLRRSTLVLALIPVVGIAGALLVNVSGNNLILLAMISCIAALFVWGVIFERNKKTYGFAILMIALALLLHVSLIGNYILPYGGDVPLEMYVFEGTRLNMNWNPLFSVTGDEISGRYNAMLSITILPTVYSNMLGMDPSWVFKIIYPLIFALVPLGLFVLWKPYIGNKLSFIAAFLFMAQSTFFTEMLALNRQMIGELFFVLLLTTLLSKKLDKQARFISFAVFSFGLIFSHYALAEIFLFLILAAWATSTFYLRRPSFNLQLGMVMFFFVAMFLWYIYTSGAVVFQSFLSFSSFISAQLGDFFNPASRGTTVLAGLGLAESPSILNTVSRGFAYLTEILIVIGVIALMAKKTPFRFDRDYKVVSILTVVFLILLTVVPGLANALSMTRFYHILLMILAPFFTIGLWFIAVKLAKRRKEMAFIALTVIILVPYFLFQTNFVYEVAGTESWSVPLSGYRMDPIQLYGFVGYIDAYSVHGAEWLATKTPYQFHLAADNALFTSLTAYGLVYRNYVTELSLDHYLYPGEYVFLSYISIKYEALSSNGTIPMQLNQTSVVYNNGYTQVNYVPDGYIAPQLLTQP